MIGMNKRTSSALLVLGLLACAFLIQVSAGKDYYSILQINRGADESEIKRAYRKLALKYHPDKVQGSKEEKETAAQKFAEISNAYEVLSDKQQRSVYDRYGEEGLKNRGAHDGGGAADIFSQFFGNFGGFRQQEEEPQTPKGADVNLDLMVTLEDVYLGRTFRFTRDKNVIKPARGERECNCRHKMKTHQLGPGMYQQYTVKECSKCPNVQYERTTQEITVTIDPGVVDGHKLIKFEEGEPLIDGDPGDLIFTVKTASHAKFMREGSNLWYNQEITLTEALVGFTREIKQLDGHTITLSSEGVTIPGAVHTIPNEGLPLADDILKHGQLYVKYSVKFPFTLTEHQKGLVRSMEIEHTEL